jgi:hypothetical protein
MIYQERMPANFASGRGGNVVSILSGLAEGIEAQRDAGAGPRVISDYAIEVLARVGDVVATYASPEVPESHDPNVVQVARAFMAASMLRRELETAVEDLLKPLEKVIGEELLKAFAGEGMNQIKLPGGTCYIHGDFSYRYLPLDAAHPEAGRKSMADLCGALRAVGHEDIVSETANWQRVRSLVKEYVGDGAATVEALPPELAAVIEPVKEFQIRLRKK